MFRPLSSFYLRRASPPPRPHSISLLRVFSFILSHIRALVTLLRRKSVHTFAIRRGINLTHRPALSPVLPVFLTHTRPSSLSTIGNSNTVVVPRLEVLLRRERNSPIGDINPRTCPLPLLGMITQKTIIFLDVNYVPRESRATSL